MKIRGQHDIRIYKNINIFLYILYKLDSILGPGDDKLKISHTSKLYFWPFEWIYLK